MNFDVNQLSIDIETLAQSETSIIATFAACVFNFKEDANATYEDILEKSFYVKLDIMDQVKRFKRTQDSATIEFWKKQDAEVRTATIKPHPDDIKVDEMLNAFKDYLECSGFDYKNSYVWTRGIAYDIPKVESLIKTVADATTENAYNFNFKDRYAKPQEKYLINTFRARDIRTFNDIIGDVSNGIFELPGGNPKGFVKHHAKHDNALDVLRMLHLFNN